MGKHPVRPHPQERKANAKGPSGELGPGLSCDRLPSALWVDSLFVQNKVLTEGETVLEASVSEGKTSKLPLAPKLTKYWTC